MMITRYYLLACVGMVLVLVGGEGVLGYWLDLAGALLIFCGGYLDGIYEERRRKGVGKHE